MLKTNVIVGYHIDRLFLAYKLIFISFVLYFFNNKQYLKTYYG